MPEAAVLRSTARVEHTPIVLRLAPQTFQGHERAPQVLRQLAELIRLPALRPPIVLGLATSVGGLDAQLASAAGSALVDAVSATAPGSAAAAAHGAADSGVSLLLGVADCVLAISSREPRCALVLSLAFHRFGARKPLQLCTATWLSCQGAECTIPCLDVDMDLPARRQPRMALPVLRTADLLFTQCFADPAEEEFANGGDRKAAASKATEQRLLALVQAVRREARGCADLARLTAAASALCHAAARGAAVRTAALPPVLALLVSRYPKARCIDKTARSSCQQPGKASWRRYIHEQCRDASAFRRASTLMTAATSLYASLSQRSASRGFDCAAPLCQLSAVVIIAWHLKVSLADSDQAAAAVQVRKHTAEQLYVQLLGEDDEDGALDDAAQTLSETAWDGDAAAARAARDRLCAQLGVEAPTPACGARPVPVSRADAPAGEGYASLLVNAARGG